MFDDSTLHKKGQASPVPPYYSKVIELKPEGDG